MTLFVMAKVDSSLRYASFRMTRPKASSRAPARNPYPSVCFLPLCLAITFRNALPSTPQDLAEKKFMP